MPITLRCLTMRCKDLVSDRGIRNRSSRHFVLQLSPNVNLPLSSISERGMLIVLRAKAHSFQAHSRGAGWCG